MEVLDKGFVELEEFMGGDNVILEAGEICTKREASNPLQLIKYMLRSSHNTCFEHTVFRFRFKAPIFVARQHMRHRIGTFNELSGRRVKLIDYYTPVNFLRPILEVYQAVIEREKEVYNYLLEKGVRKEQARGILGTAFYTEYIWTVNLWSLLNWLKKRIANDAQYEHQRYAFAVLKILGEIDKIKIAMEAINEYL